MSNLRVVRGGCPPRRPLPVPRPQWRRPGRSAWHLPALAVCAGLVIGGERIRLLGLDAPEGRQVCQRGGVPWRCGDDATMALRSLVAGRSVTCEVKGRDRYQRALAVCMAAGVDVAREMVRRGLAVAYYPAKGVRGPSYEAEEAEAEAAQRGLWGGSFVRPSEWRQGER